MAQNVDTIELLELPDSIKKDLQNYVTEYNKKLEPIDEFSSYNPRIKHIPNNAYLYDNKCLIPIVESGSNFAFTIFVLWDGEIKKTIYIHGYAFYSMEKIEKANLLKINYNAGCCNARYLAIGLLSLLNQTINNLFILPKFAQNTKNRSDGGEFNGDVFFRLYSDMKVGLNSTTNNYSIEQNYWVDINPEEHKEYNVIEIPKRKPIITVNMLFDVVENKVYLNEENKTSIKFLKNIEFPNTSINSISLMQKFVCWIETNLLNKKQYNRK